MASKLVKTKNRRNGNLVNKRSIINDDIRHPFDPKKVRIHTNTISLDALCQRIEHNEINLKPAYQRRDDIWTHTAQSRLVESLLIRVPIPAFYVDATTEDNWQVIDGLQRMSILKKFVVDKTMQLKNLEFIKELNGLTYDELHRKFQRRILETQVIIFAIQPGTPTNIKFNIFKRVNTGGKPLTAQEIRNAIYQGQSTKILNNISNDPRYISSPGAVTSLRMADKELILRYFTYIRLDPFNLVSETLDTRLNATMEDWLSNKDDNEIKRLENQFFSSLICISNIFGSTSFRRPGTIESTRKRPINKPLFEAWMVLISRLSKKQKEKIVENSKTIKNEFKKLENDDAFEQSIFQGTAKPDHVKIRFEKIGKVITRALNK